MELHKIIIRQIDAKYLRKTVYNFFLRKEEDCSISSEIFLNPTTLRIRKQVAKAASGIIIEFVRKSKKSRNAIPKI